MVVNIDAFIKESISKEQNYVKQQNSFFAISIKKFKKLLLWMLHYDESRKKNISL